jgi:hypothetical protein
MTQSHTEAAQRCTEKRWRGGLVLLFLVVCLVGLMGQVGGREEAPAAEGIRFVPVDVMVDSGKRGLGAYQVEVKALEGVKMVGVEGGDAGAFREAPFYDPAALVDGERIVIAAFSTDDPPRLPSGNVRVARLHLTAAAGVQDAALEKMTSRLVVATDADGKSIAATLSLRVYQGDKR